MFFEFFLGMRYLKAKRKQGFISVITVISVLGVMVGVMSLVVVLSVMNGFRQDLMSKILGVNSDLLVLSYGGTFTGYENVAEKVVRTEGVLAVTPFIYSQVIVNHEGSASGAILRGLDPKTAGRVVRIEDMIKMGSLDSLEMLQDGLPAVILGRQLARQVGAFPGETVTLVSPEGKLTPLGRAPNTQRYKVTAIFDSGMYEYDASMIFLSIKEAQAFLGLGDKVTGLEVKVKDIYQADQVAKSIQDELGQPFWTKDWKMMNRSLFGSQTGKDYHVRDLDHDCAGGGPQHHQHPGDGGHGEDQRGGHSQGDGGIGPKHHVGFHDPGHFGGADRNDFWSCVRLGAMLSPGEIQVHLTAFRCLLHLHIARPGGTHGCVGCGAGRRAHFVRGDDLSSLACFQA